MGFKVLLSSSKWDAVAYARNRSEDTQSPQVVLDDAYKIYAEMALEDYSRLAPMEVQVGSPAPTITSPFKTVANQQRYICNSGNGFTYRPLEILRVGYGTLGLYNTSDWGYLRLVPGSTGFGRFEANTPTSRIMQDRALSELSSYSQSYYDVVFDPSGYLAIDLFPIPSSATPVLVQYTAQHPQSVDVQGNFLYPTVPEQHKQHVAKLLYATILEEEVERFSRFRKARAGMIEVDTNPRGLMDMSLQIKEDVYNALGGALGVATVSS